MRKQPKQKQESRSQRAPRKRVPRLTREAVIAAWHADTSGKKLRDLLLLHGFGVPVDEDWIHPDPFRPIPPLFPTEEEQKQMEAEFAKIAKELAPVIADEEQRVLWSIGSEVEEHQKILARSKALGDRRIIR